MAGATAVIEQAAGLVCTPQPIGVDQSITGSLSAQSCLSPIRQNTRAARYSFFGNAGQKVTISATSSAIDTYLYLLSPDGSLLAENDDISRTDLNSRIPASGFLTLPVSGIYIAEVTTSAAAVTGSFTLTVGSGRIAMLKMTISPDPVSQNPASADCPWRHDVIVTEQSGIGVNLNRWVAGGHDLSTNIASWFGSARLDPLSTRRTTLCWKEVAVPTTKAFDVVGRDDAGNDVRATAQARFEGVSAQLQELRVAPESLTFSAVASRAELLSAVANVNSGGLAWTGRIAYNGAARNWLTVFPLSGVGRTGVTVTASAAGIIAGRHTATLMFESPGVNPVEIPVALVVGSQASPSPQFNLSSVVNAASFQRTLAPGMLFTILGSNLGSSDALASQVPLPYTLGNTTVRVNNILCPLLYVSGRQINAQLPYEIAAGVVSLTVNVEGRELTSQVGIGAVAPGLFTIDGQRPTPHFSGRRGDVVLAYLTGVGAVIPQVPTGGAPSASTPITNLPKPQAAPEVTVGGIRAEVMFAGIPPGIVGTVQVNYRIPPNVPLGSQSVVFSVGGVQTNAVTLNVQP